MKTRMLAAAAAMMLALTLSAQEMTQEQYKQKYDRLVSRVGADGVGVETVLNRWEADYPDDINMLLGKFIYYFSKSRTTEVVRKDVPKYLGQDPVMSLQDSLGNTANFFEEPSFEDSVFTFADQAIEKAVRLAPTELDYRFAKANALLAYEKESPDMTLSYLTALVDQHYTQHPAWTYGSEAVTEEEFASFIQEYCVSLFRLATPGSYEAFRALSETMLKYNPSSALFADNVASYYLVGQKDTKAALKRYEKVLKAHPDDQTAIRNCILIARRDKNVKLEKKYLAMMVKYAQNEGDRLSASTRLEYLNGKK